MGPMRHLLRHMLVNNELMIMAHDMKGLFTTENPTLSKHGPIYAVLMLALAQIILF